MMHTQILENIFKNDTPDNGTMVVNCNNCPEAFKKFFTLEDIKKGIESANPDGESSYKGKFTENYLKTSNWASSSGLSCSRFTDAHITAYLEDLFKKIALVTSGKKYAEENILARNNLFHGHMMFNGTLKDLLIIFHAFEYPEDIENRKSNHASTLEPGVLPFKSSSEAFMWRNSIYSRAKNRIYILNAQAEEYKELFPSKLIPVLDQSECGQKLCDINYFPKEEVNLFLA